LGIHSIQSILLILSMKNNFQWTPQQHELLPQIFLHATLVNYCFLEFHHSIFGRRVDRENTSLGLLYDIGMVLLLQFFPDRFHQVHEYQQQHSGKSFYECEIELGYQGTTHAELGAYLLQWWNFSDKIVELALFHHEPDQMRRENQHLAKTLQSAERFAEYLLQKYPDTDLDPDRLRHPNISTDNLKDLASEVYRKIQQQTEHSLTAGSQDRSDTPSTE